MDTTRARAHRLTRQRKLVLEIIKESQGHLDAETLYLQAKTRHAPISLATVYRSLAFLKDAGLVQEQRLGEDHGHFESAQTTPHYHFTCLSCGQVIEFEAPQVLELARWLSAKKNLQVTELNLHLSGYCAQCAGRSQPAAPKTRI